MNLFDPCSRSHTPFGRITLVFCCSVTLIIISLSKHFKIDNHFLFIPDLKINRDKKDRQDINIIE